MSSYYAQHLNEVLTSTWNALDFDKKENVLNGGSETVSITLETGQEIVVTFSINDYDVICNATIKGSIVCPGALL